MATPPPKALRYFDGKQGTLTVDFALNDNGHITCIDCAGKIWCNHLQYAMIHNQDAKAIWEKPEDAMHFDFIDLEIPVFPTDDLWTKVHLRIMRESPVPRYQVNWEEGPTGLSKTVTYLNPGEGRNVIRTCLVDYMFSDPTRVLECKAAHHSPAAQAIWQNQTSPVSNRRYAQWWAVYTTEQCLTCLQGAGSVDDLVPEKQNNGVWN